VDIEKELCIKLSIVEIIQRSLFYFGQVVRMSEEGTRVYSSMVKSRGTRPKRRPRKKWIDSNQEDCSEMRLPLINADRLACVSEQMEVCCTDVGLTACVDYRLYVFVAKASSQVKVSDVFWAWWDLKTVK